MYLQSTGIPSTPYHCWYFHGNETDNCVIENMYCVVPENNQTSLIESLFSETPYITMEIPINLHAFLLIFLVFEPIAPLLPKELPIPSVEEAGGGGVLSYITYTGMCRPTGSWFWSPRFRTGYPFQRRFLEWGIIFRTHENSCFVSSHLKLLKDRLLFKIRFNALTSKLLHSCCTLERSIKNRPISRTGYQF